MKFSIGDQVRLKQTGEEGYVLARLSDIMVEVKVLGVSFPAFEDDLEHPYLHWFTSRPEQAKAKVTHTNLPTPNAKPSPRLPKGIFLAFFPEYTPDISEEELSSFKIFLLNETAENIHFDCQVLSADKSKLFQLKGQLHAFGKIYLLPLSLAALQEQPRIHWAYSHLPSNLNPTSGTIRLRPALIIKFLQTIHEENLAFCSIQLLENEQAAKDVKSAISLPAGLLAHSSERTLAPTHTLITEAQPIIDLHLKAIIKSRPQQMSKEEMLQIQLNYLQRKLQAALVAGLPELIIIHGVGNGSLKNAVHKTLSELSLGLRFQNEWMPGYGWGATKVWLTKK